NFVMQSRWRAGVIDRQVGVKLRDCAAQGRPECFSALPWVRPDDNGAKLRRGRRPEERNIEAAAVVLLIEWTLHESVRNHPNNRAPRERLSRIENPHPASEGTLVAKILSGKARIHDRDRLSRVIIVKREVAAL